MDLVPNDFLDYEREPYDEKAVSPLSEFDKTTILAFTMALKSYVDKGLIKGVIIGNNFKVQVPKGEAGMYVIGSGNYVTNSKDL